MYFGVKKEKRGECGRAEVRSVQRLSVLIMIKGSLLHSTEVI